MRFYRKNSGKSLEEKAFSSPGSGIGTLYGSKCNFSAKLLVYFSTFNHCECCQWLTQELTRVAKDDIGILREGIAAAVLCDLGFKPREGAVIMQLIAAPGFAAHGLEYAPKRLSEGIFEDDSLYQID